MGRWAAFFLPVAILFLSLKMSPNGSGRITSDGAAKSVTKEGEDSAVVANQNPSPMVEYVRAHKRIKRQEYPGIDFKLTGVLPKVVDVFVPERSLGSTHFDLLIHFHGAGYVVRYAATQFPRPLIAASVTLGEGSSVYGHAFRKSTEFSTLVDSIDAEVRNRLNRPVKIRHIILSAWSAGYGAVRQILSVTRNYDRVYAVLLLDGIHASYIPEGRVLAEGGKIDSSELAVFLHLAQDASRRSSGKRFLITHSEIFPGTFVSTTEATHYILEKLGMKEKAVLRWGPLGMQQLGNARRNHFEIMGFAGNTAPDHVDHFEGLYYFLKRLMRL